MRLALIVEYDGADYHGFQYQRGAPTIQEELENAIAKLVGVRSRVQGAGRTDAGVHATGQVVAFDTEAGHSPGIFVRALNYHLPDDIAVKATYRVGPEFDPRRMALSRRYVYSIYAGATPSPLIRRTSWPGGDKLRVRKMQAAARHLVGVHDFARFAGPLGKPGGSTVREITETRVSRRGDLIVFEVEGNAFLPHQVRRMAGALVDVGREKLMPADVLAMLDGSFGGAVAHSLPPHGLCLVKVTYRDFPPRIGE